MDAHVLAHKVPVATAESLIKYIRILAKAGRKRFIQYLCQPLEKAGWKIGYSNETTHKMMSRIEHLTKNEHTLQTIPPQCKRMICLSLTENLSAVGDCSIFFLAKMIDFLKISSSPEAKDFVRIIHPPIQRFISDYNLQSQQRFATSLSSLTPEQLSLALEPVALGRRNVGIKLEKEAYILFQKISIANKNGNLNVCKKLLRSYLIRFGDASDNNIDEIEKLISAFEKREKSFRQELYNLVAIDLYYKIVSGITEDDLKITISAIRKYAAIFRGNPDTLYYQEIDKLEGRLYKIIKQKDLWQKLGK